MSVHRGRIVLRLERLIIAIGLGCLAWCAFTIIEASWWQREHRKALELAPTAPDHGSATSVAELTAIRPGDPIGEVEVRRLRLSAVIVEGDDDASLKVAVGHLPDTPLPWDSGNTALAAHRDTYFRPLKDIKAGDIVRLSTPRGRFDYRVRETMVVSPEDVWVLDPTDRPTVTLITCYPFSYAGHAPQRFIVRAERVDGAQQHRRT